ncbi:protein kinase domain-containing protein [Bacillus salacetis]|uniref:protein kinase domain-containing protein n=1 Tax=Bacillus salacetis TaxID=2315464 RepID=UPI003B9E6B59
MIIKRNEKFRTGYWEEIIISYSDYIKIKNLGGGGNGIVSLRSKKDQVPVAVKVSKIKNPNSRFQRVRLERFKNEAIKMYELTTEDVAGIIPVLHYELPCQETGEYFYVMPLATPLPEVLSSINLYEKIDIFKDLATTLEYLHGRGITHRDIKPENILYYEGKYCLADFGLIDFPEKEDLTKLKESLGNRKTMAPEMREAFLIKDSRPADVYSIAKTLWLVLTEEEFAFDGQFNYYQDSRLGIMYPGVHFVELYKLLQDSTSEEPTKRPSMKEFLSRLIEWDEISKNERRASKSAWRFFEDMVITQHPPSTVIWREKDQVIKILKNFSKINFNHTFIHDGGGMDLIDITEFNFVEEDDMVLINFGFNMLNIFKVKRLVWELPNEDPEFSYFRLEFENIEPIYPEAAEATYKWIQEDPRDTVNEDLIINEIGQYEPYREDEEQALFHVTRWFNGSLLIVPKGSIYNSIHETYDGRHSKLSSDDFREYMELLQYIYNHKILEPYFFSIAKQNPTEDNLLEDLKSLKKMTDAEIVEALKDNN